MRNEMHAIGASHGVHLCCPRAHMVNDVWHTSTQGSPRKIQKTELVAMSSGICMPGTVRICGDPRRSLRLKIAVSPTMFVALSEADVQHGNRDRGENWDVRRMLLRRGMRLLRMVPKLVPSALASPHYGSGVSALDKYCVALHVFPTTPSLVSPQHTYPYVNSSGVREWRPGFGTAIDRGLFSTFPKGLDHS